jgi:hypothetical protein
MRTPAKFRALSAIMMCLCALGMFIPVVIARDSFAPSWLVEGTYVKYESSLPGSSGSALAFFNLSNPKFTGTNYVLSGQKLDLILETKSSSLMWQCKSVNDTMAKLQVTLDYVGELKNYVDNSSETVPVQRTAEVYVDLYNRGVYNVNGTFLGTTHLWLPANPDNGQEITIWEENSETVTSPVTTTSDSWTTTVQGNQDIFQTDAYVTIKNNPYLMLNLYCDLDTGLSLGIIFWDPVFAAVGIANGPASVSETNINLGPERSVINWNQIMYYSIIPIAIVLLVVTLLIKRRRKKN